MYQFGQKVLLKRSNGTQSYAVVTQIKASSYVLSASDGVTKEVLFTHAHEYISLPTGPELINPNNAPATSWLPPSGEVWKKPVPGVTCPHIKSSTGTQCPNLPNTGSVYCYLHAPMFTPRTVNDAIPAWTAAQSTMGAIPAAAASVTSYFY